MTKIILPGMIIVDKGTDIIHVVIFVCTKEVYAISLDQIKYNQYKSIEYVKFTKDYFQFVADHYCD